MKIKKINLINTELPKKSAFAIETDPNFIKMHSLMILNGKRGGGKTVALCNFLKECKSKHYLDKVFVITPTYNSNKEIWNIADIDESDVLEPDSTSIKETIIRCEAEKAEWDDFLLKKELYKQFLKDAKKPITRISDENLINYYNYNFYEEEPKWKYKIEQAPRMAIVLDDCLNTDVMAKRTSGLSNLCIRHRHICDGLGVSIFMLVQSYCSHGGVPRVIRENCTNLLLFKINDENQIKKIKEEADLEITDDEFTELLNYCHAEPFQFLMIDFVSKCPTKKFRKGFNEFVIPKSLEGKCTCNKN